jgi:hypothetical protein
MSDLVLTIRDSGLASDCGLGITDSDKGPLPQTPATPVGLTAAPTGK